MEKLLITQALDERDFLAKKIKEKIKETEFVAFTREKDPKYKGRPVEEVEQEISSSFQSITDMIDRYKRINAAITLSNATTKIKFKDGTEMTKAEAIAKRQNFSNPNTNFEQLLCDRMQRDYSQYVIGLERQQKQIDDLRQNYTETMLSTNEKKVLDAGQIEAIETLLKPYEIRSIDPIDIKNKIEDIREKTLNFINEVDTLLKVSNATEFVEF